MLNIALDLLFILGFDRGVASAMAISGAFSVVVSALVFVFAAPLTGIFVDPGETRIVSLGVDYLHIEGSFYVGIGLLFLLYGYYRTIRMPAMSVVLTAVQLGLRVALAYWLASVPAIDVN